jgi:hypothetical protein
MATRQMVQRLAFLTMPPSADASVVRDNLVDYAYFLCRFQRDFVPGLGLNLMRVFGGQFSEVSGKALLPTWDHAIMAFG